MEKVVGGEQSYDCVHHCGPAIAVTDALTRLRASALRFVVHTSERKTKMFL